MRKAFILAGSKVQYDFFIKTGQLDQTVFKNLRSMEQLWGCLNPLIIKVGTYYMNPIHGEVYEWEKLYNV